MKKTLLKNGAYAALKTTAFYIAFSLLSSPFSLVHAQSSLIRPENSQDYRWNGLQWELTHNATYQYNSEGYETDILRHDPATGNVLNRTTVTYDAYDNRTELRHDFFQNNTWRTSYGDRHDYAYNSTGQLTEDIFKAYNVSAKTWENKTRVVHIYTAGKLTETIRYTWKNNSWQEKERELNNFNGNNISQTLVQRYKNSGWQDSMLIKDITWHNSNKDYKSYLAQRWNGTAWKDSLRYQANHSQHNSYVATLEQMKSSKWENFSRTTIDYDSQKNYTGGKLELWQNNAWVNTTENKTLLKYDGQNNVLERVMQYYNANTGNMVNDRKYVYSNFKIVQPTGISDPEKHVKIDVYPNPAVNALTIRHTSENPLQIQLTDLNGKLLHTETITAAQQQVDISGLAAGIYLLQISGENSVSQTLKILKE